MNSFDHLKMGYYAIFPGSVFSFEGYHADANDRLSVIEFIGDVPVIIKIEKESFGRTPPVFSFFKWENAVANYYSMKKLEEDGGFDMEDELYKVIDIDYELDNVPFQKVLELALRAYTKYEEESFEEFVHSQLFYLSNRDHEKYFDDYNLEYFEGDIHKLMDDSTTDLNLQRYDYILNNDVDLIIDELF